MTNLTADEAVETLEGKTAYEVAALLRAAGVTGSPGSLAFCPIANYLRKVTGGTVSRVTALRLYVGTVDYLTPEGATEFIERFDGGREFTDLNAGRDDQ